MPSPDASFDSLRKAIFFVLATAIATPLLLVAFWEVMPFYARGLGALTGWILEYLFRAPLEAVEIRPGGILNTQTKFIFITGGKESGADIARMISNLAPYAALILCTPGITWRRRFWGWLTGTTILSLAHLIFIILFYQYRGFIATHEEIPMAIGHVFITLPFLLWLCVAFMGRIRGGDEGQ